MASLHKKATFGAREARGLNSPGHIPQTCGAQLRPGLVGDDRAAGAALRATTPSLVDTQPHLGWKPGRSGSFPHSPLSVPKVPVSPECTGFLPPLGRPGLRCVTEGEQGQETVLGASLLSLGPPALLLPRAGEAWGPNSTQSVKMLPTRRRGGPREQQPPWCCHSVTCSLPVPSLTVAQDSLGLGAYLPSGPPGCGREAPWAPILPHGSRPGPGEPPPCTPLCTSVPRRAWSGGGPSPGMRPSPGPCYSACSLQICGLSGPCPHCPGACRNEPSAGRSGTGPQGTPAHSECVRSQVQSPEPGPQEGGPGGCRREAEGSQSEERNQLRKRPEKPDGVSERAGPGHTSAPEICRFCTLARCADPRSPRFGGGTAQ